MKLAWLRTDDLRIKGRFSLASFILASFRTAPKLACVVECAHQKVVVGTLCKHNLDRKIFF